MRGLLAGVLLGFAVVAQITNGGAGVTLPASCVKGSVYVLTTDPVTQYVCSDNNAWTAVGGSASSLPAGAIVLIKSGTCPAGFSEDAALDGKTLVGTLAANGNVGGTGGSDAITPAGVNSGGAVSAHAGAAVADHASHTHTYTDVLNHTHTVSVTDPGHTHNQASQTATTGSASSWEHGAIDTSSAAAETLPTASATTGITASTANPAGGVASGTTAGPSATLTHSVTQPSAHTFTQPTFTGTQFDNRSAFVRVIFCRKT